MFELEFINNLPQEFRSLVLRVLLALLALLIIWLLRRLLSGLILLPFRRLVVERTQTQIDDLLLTTVEAPIRLLVVAIGVAIAGQILSADGATVEFMAHLSRTFVILAVMLTLHNLVDLVAASSARLRSLTGLRLEEQLVPFLRTGLKIILVALAVVVLLQEWEYDVSGLIAGLGLGGLAFSLAAQDTVANLFAFTTIVSDRPFVVGEYIKTADVEGIVEQVGVRNVRIRQLDQAYVTIPNAKLTSSAITNWSRLQKRWINFTLGVTYSTTSDQMRVLVHRIREMLNAQEKVDPESIVVLFTDFGDSSLDVLVRCYIWEPDWVKFSEHKQDINLRIMDIVADLGLSIAFPSRSLYVENLSMLDNGKGLQLRPPAPAKASETLPPAESSRALYPGTSEGDSNPGDEGERG